MDIKEGMKVTSSSGGTITYRFDKNGQRIGLIHTVGTAYSGKVHQTEDKPKKD